MADEELTPKQLLVKTEPYAPKPLKEKTPKNSRSLDNISKKIESSEEEDEQNNLLFVNENKNGLNSPSHSRTLANNFNKDSII